LKRCSLADETKSFAIAKRLELGRSYMPRAADPVTSFIAGRLVIFPGVQRRSFVSPHHLAVIAGKNCPSP
jgi:hypothetical protein